MSSYKLYYYNYRSRAEAIRFLLSYGGVEFEDIRFEDEEWPEIKPTMPYGKVPVLEIDDVKYSHTMSICNYLGEQFGINGADELEKMQIQTAALFIYDIVGITEDITYHYKDSLGEENFETEIQKLANETIPAYFEKFEDILDKNQGNFVNGKITWVDLYFASVADYFPALFNHAGVEIDANFVEKYDLLRNLRDKVYSIISIQDWMERRPETEA